ncbi:MAG: hypothetical protein ACRYF0_08725 [Janthinobacterium lividum]
MRLLAQSQPTDPTRATLDNIFARLDKTQVPTGLLAESALPLVPLDVFNGTLTDSSRTTPDGFRYVYATLYSARVSGTQPLLSLADYNGRISAAEASFGPATIPVMVQRVSYATVRPDAFSQNLLSYNSNTQQVADVAGRTQNPYVVRTAFAAAPTRPFVAGATVQLVLASALEVQSGGAPIAGRYLDFGDGLGYRAATLNQPLSATYSTAGAKRIKVRYTYNYSYDILESWFDITVTNVAPVTAVTTLPAGSSNTARQTAAFDGRVNPIAGVRAGGTASVIFGANHTEITKPLIVVEGFDPSDVAPLIQRNLGINDFTIATSNPNGFNFYRSYINAGYDLIYINYDSGTDDVLLNAALFEEVLNRVNAAKTGNEQNVVLGISMGGVVARYQLADMVKNNRPTQTRLLILQDSPQRGANVPLGIQALLRQANINFGSFTIFDINKYLQQATAMLDSPASQQLLLYRATNATNGFAANTFIEGAYRQKITFPTGQTPPYQIIAASQGSQCGTPLFAPYTELLRLDGKIFISPLPWIIRTSYYAQTIANALPAGGQSNRVATLQLYNIVRLFGFINLRNNFIRQDYTCPSGLLAVDGVAGGTNYIGGYIPAGVLPKPASYGFGPFFQLAFSYTFTRDFCFVPTASALDLADFNQTSFSGKFINGIASTSTSRTNGFIAQESFTQGPGTYYNQFHTVFSARNSEWMFNKMQGSPVPSSFCSTECNSLSELAIAGPAFTCVGQPATYTVPGLPAGTAVSWAISGVGLAPAGSTTGPNFPVTTTGRGQAIIQATLTDPCGQVVNLTLNVGAGNPLLIDPQNEQCGFTATAYAPGFTSLQWQINLDEPAADFQPTVYVPFSHGYASATLSGYNTCTGQYESVTSTRRATPGTYCPTAASEATLYPNPANQETSVTMQEAPASQRQAAAPSAKTGTLGVRIYDGHGQLRLERQVTGTALNHLPTATLPVGLYIVHVLQNGVIVDRQPLQVQR